MFNYTDKNFVWGGGRRLRGVGDRAPLPLEPLLLDVDRPTCQNRQAYRRQQCFKLFGVTPILFLP